MRKSHTPAPVPKGNKLHIGPPTTPDQEGLTPDQEALRKAAWGGDQEKDPKDRQGDYVGKGEHPIKQPGTHSHGG